MIGIVIVSYKNFQGTVKFVTKELCKILLPWKVVIVDNCSDTLSGNKLAEACGGVCVQSQGDIQDKDERVFVLPVEDNLGYARGNNLGAKFLLDNFDCDYLLFTNDDIVLEDADVVSKLIDCFEIHEVGAVGPRVVGIDGIDQSPHHKVITPSRQLGWKFFSLLRKRKKENLGASEKPQSSYCYWVSGCFFLMRTEDFQSVEGFDPSTFLYAEEVILAERLKRIGKREYFCADTHVVHYGGCSTQSIQNNKLEQILKESNCIYYRKYLHSNPIIVWLYKTFC